MLSSEITRVSVFVFDVESDMRTANPIRLLGVKLLGRRRNKVAPTRRLIFQIGAESQWPEFRSPKLTNSGYFSVC